MHILIVAYYFPPFNSVGAVRPGKFASWLQTQGHHVHVLTCSNQPFPKGLPLEILPSEVTAVPGWSVNAPVEWLRGGRDKVAREGYGINTAGGSAIGRLGRLYKSLLHWPDGQLGWVGAATRAGRELVRMHRFDLVYASAPPFSALRVAATLAREADLPWVAELRDLWTDNHVCDVPAWRRAIDRHWEAGLLRSAAGLVTVSPPLVDKLQRFGRPVWEVRNGCDPEDFVDLERPANYGGAPDVLDIAFTGNVYDRYYDVDAFCAGLALDAARGGRVRVHVAGRNSVALRAAAQFHGVDTAFNFKATVPRTQALAMQRHADLLLAFLWGGEGQAGVYSAKLFEYAGAGRPVLAVGTPNDVGELITSAGLGEVCVDAKQVATALARARARKLSEGALIARPGPGYDFSRAAQFASLALKLQAITTRQQRKGK